MVCFGWGKLVLMVKVVLARFVAVTVVAAAESPNRMFTLFAK